MANTAQQVLGALRECIQPDKAAFLPGFFRAVPGGYGEGDRFLGVVVPDQRKIAKRFRELPRKQVLKLLASPWHECRLTGLFILVHQFDLACKAGRTHRDTRRHSAPRTDANDDAAKEIVDCYLDHLSAVNNWDLVDATAPKILGRWLLDHPQQRSVLDRLAGSEVLWERRVAILATLPLIRDEQFDEILTLAERLIKDDHFLMHKAIGWMLREVGKRDAKALNEFLGRHAGDMPRTMLRYAIEKMPERERKRWLKK